MPPADNEKTDVEIKEGPPPYENPAATHRSTQFASTPIREVLKVTDGRRPTNFLYIVGKYNYIQGTYVIDPSLHIPEQYLPPLDTGLGIMRGEWKNLYLRNDDDNGTVDLDLWIVGCESSETVRDPMRRTKMCVSAQGSVTIKIVRPLFLVS